MRAGVIGLRGGTRHDRTRPDQTRNRLSPPYDLPPCTEVTGMKQIEHCDYQKAGHSKP